MFIFLASCSHCWFKLHFDSNLGEVQLLWLIVLGTLIMYLHIYWCSGQLWCLCCQVKLCNADGMAGFSVFSYMPALFLATQKMGAVSAQDLELMFMKGAVYTCNKREKMQPPTPGVQTCNLPNASMMLYLLCKLRVNLVPATFLPSYFWLKPPSSFQDQQGQTSSVPNVKGKGKNAATDNEVLTWVFTNATKILASNQTGTHHTPSESTFRWPHWMFGYVSGLGDNNGFIRPVKCCSINWEHFPSQTRVKCPLHQA